MARLAGIPGLRQHPQLPSYHRHPCCLTRGFTQPDAADAAHTSSVFDARATTGPRPMRHESGNPVQDRPAGLCGCVAVTSNASMRGQVRPGNYVGNTMFNRRMNQLEDDGLALWI
jgi:hypothetical protein